MVVRKQSSSLLECSGSSLVITKWRRALEWVGSSAATAVVELGLCVSDGEGCLFLLLYSRNVTAVADEQL